MNDWEARTARSKLYQNSTSAPPELHFPVVFFECALSGESKSWRCTDEPFQCNCPTVDQYGEQRWQWLYWRCCSPRSFPLSGRGRIPDSSDGGGEGFRSGRSGAASVTRAKKQVTDRTSQSIMTVYKHRSESRMRTGNVSYGQ